MRRTGLALGVTLALALGGCGESHTGVTGDAAAGGDATAGADGLAAVTTSGATLKDARTAPIAAPRVGGRWTETTPWPFLPVHAAMTPDGRVLTYGGNGGNQGGQVSYDVWDPAIADPSQAHLTLPNGTYVDTFCSSGLLLPQSGNVVIASGDSNGRAEMPYNRNRDLVAYDYRDSGLKRLERGLNHQRWYGTMTMLTSGEIMVQGGSCWNGTSDVCGGAVIPTTPELYRAGRGWVPLTGARSDDVFGNADMRWWYPRAWQAPDGRVFGMTAGLDLYAIDPAGQGTIQKLGQFDRRHYGATNSAVMYRPGKILVTGGGGVDSNGQEPNGSSAATIIDITGGTPVTRSANAMRQGRQWHNSTVLADGRVLVTGGSTRNNTLDGVTYNAEIWDPDTGTWTLGNAADTPRLYHSFALLLPDGRVLTGGGGAPGPGPYISGEIYSPPYLFDANGAPAARPAIVNAPGQIGGASSAVSIDVASSKAIRKVTLVGAGSVTHSFNMGQRYVELAYTQTGGTLSARLPANRHDLPPGFYMLFVVDADGTPSVAKMVRVLTPDVQPSPDQEVDANLINNGSFEASSSEFVLADNSYAVANWPGWFNSSGSRIEVWRRNGGIEAVDGQNLMELDVYGGTRDQVYQGVTTVRGKRYRLSLWYSARPGNSADSNAFEVTWNGQRVAAAAPEGRGQTTAVWQKIEVFVTGTGRDQLLLGETGADDGGGALIDDIRLVGADNLLANGSFEDNRLAVGDYAQTPAPGWSSPTGVAEIWRKHRGYTAANGQSWIELDVNAGSVDRIEQTVNTTAGQPYRLSLSFAARPGTAADTSAFQVWWNGVLVETVTPPVPGTGPRDLDWRTRSWVVMGNGQDRVSIVEAGADDSLGAMIDDVTLVPDAPLQANGGFETNEAPSGGWVNRPMPGWTNAAGFMEAWRNLNVAAASGSSLAELDVGGGLDVIGQSMLTQPGRSYRITYAYRARPGVSADSNAFAVRWNGRVVATHQPDGNAAGAGWQTGQITVTGTGFDRVEFAETGQNDGVGALLDDVKVTLVK